MKINFNVNNQVEVVLTEVGAKIINNHYRSIFRYKPEYLPRLRVYKKGDILKEELCFIMEIFGSHYYMGCDIPFENNSITFTVDD